MLIEDKDTKLHIKWLKQVALDVEWAEYGLICLIELFTLINGASDIYIIMCMCKMALYHINFHIS